MFMPHTIMPPLTAEIGNIFSISSSHFHAAYLHTHICTHFAEGCPPGKCPAQEVPPRVSLIVSIVKELNPKSHFL